MSLLPTGQAVGVFLTMLVPFLGTVYAAVLVLRGQCTWMDLLVLAITYSLGALSITIGYHRLLSHQSFVPHPLLKLVLLMLGASASMGAPVGFQLNHLHHHRTSDTLADFHSPNRSPWQSKLMRLLFAHELWRLYDARFEADLSKLRMNQDPVVRFVSRTWFFWLMAELVLIFALAGWSGLLWGGLVRFFLINQVTFSVNSICHLYGTHEFETHDHSGNVRWLALATFGDSLHNVHHAFPYTYDNALLPGTIDLSAWVIRFFARCGWATNLRRPTPAQVLQKLKPEHTHLLA